MFFKKINLEKKIRKYTYQEEDKRGQVVGKVNCTNNDFSKHL